jgi:hypothetical protein
MAAVQRGKLKNEEFTGMFLLAVSYQPYVYSSLKQSTSLA